MVTPKVEMQAQQVTAKPPKPWFCFRCGEDGHMAQASEGSINKRACGPKVQRAQSETR